MAQDSPKKSATQTSLRPCMIGIFDIGQNAYVASGKENELLEKLKEEDFFKLTIAKWRFSSGKTSHSQQE